MTEQIEDQFWAQARAEDAAARGRQADPGACGTCRGNVAAGGQVEHDECAQRATLLQAPDHPGYELITGLSEEELAALPPRFHVPAYMESSSPQMWVCAVCWGDGWVSQWPCKTAVKNGLRVFTDEHQAETAVKRQTAELTAYRALDLGDVDGRVSASCDNPEHPTWLRAPDDTRGCPWCQIAELEAQRERRRLRLIALQNDALDMRGSLSPNGQDRKVPFPLGETLTPAVDWLIGRVAELEARLDEMTHCRDNALRALYRDDVDTDIDLEETIAAPFYGPGWDWDETDLQPVVKEAANAVRPAFGKLTQQRDQARAIAVTLEQENAELEAERAKYVGKEPTIAEEMAYLSRCLDSVHDVCDQVERQATRWEQPLPVPEWVATVRAAADGEWAAGTPRPALPWAHTMDDGDLHLFLDDLASAAIDRWRSDPEVPDRTVLADLEKVCTDWRTPGRGLRSDEPGTGERNA